MQRQITTLVLAVACARCGGDGFADAAQPVDEADSAPEAAPKVEAGVSEGMSSPGDELPPLPEAAIPPADAAAELVADADWTGPQWGPNAGQIHSCSQDVDCQPACEAYGMQSFCAGGSQMASDCKSTVPFKTGCGDCECKCDLSDAHQVYECNAQCSRGGFKGGRCDPTSTGGVCVCL